MEKTITGYELPVNALAAALICAGDQDVRYYLNGVYLDFPNGRIVATDGHRLFCGAITPADCEPAIVPRKLVEQVLKAHKSQGKRDRERFNTLAVSVGEAIGEQGDKLRSLTLAHPAVGFTGTGISIDATFPDYERVIPREDSEAVNTCGNYDLQYLADAGKALALYAGAENERVARYCHVQQNGPHIPCTVARYDSPAFVVIMPVRSGDTAPDRAWFIGQPATAEQVAA